MGIYHLLNFLPVSCRAPLPQLPTPFNRGKDCQIMRQSEKGTQDEGILVAQVDSPRGNPLQSPVNTMNGMGCTFFTTQQGELTRIQFRMTSCSE